MTVSQRYKNRGPADTFANIWNPQNGTFAGRNGRSWANILLYYIVFYGALAVLGSICMWVLFQTLDPRIPKYQLESSAIGSNPGLGFRPMPTEDNMESTLIWFQSSNKTSYLKWVNNLKAFLEKYYQPGKIEKGTATTKTCSYLSPPREGDVCGVQVEDWKECGREKFFDYHRNEPCIFLKLNRIYGWVPDYYNDTRTLPRDMPLQLQYHIGNRTVKQRNTVWISCEGENPADVEYLGPILYFPKEIQGFPGYYYPYKNGEGYLSPLVAVQFKNPTHGIVINIECKAWARNIVHSRLEKTGIAHFELLID